MRLTRRSADSVCVVMSGTSVGGGRVGAGARPGRWGLGDPASCGAGYPSAATSLTNWSHDSAGLMFLVTSARTRAFCSSFITGKYFVPLYGATVTATARSAKISPLGASLKNGRVTASSSSAVCRSTWLGKLPVLTNALSCCSGSVSQAASAFASSLWSPWSGTVRYDPPQLPPPFGNTLAMSQVVTSGDMPSMFPRNQLGQRVVAKAPDAKPASQSLVHCWRPADRPSLAARTESYASLTTGLVVAMTSPSRDSRVSSSWFSTPCMIAPAPSNQAASLLAVNCSPTE